MVRMNIKLKEERTYILH